MKPTSMVYWLRLVFAILGAVLVFGSKMKGSELVVLAGILAYTTSCLFVRFGLNYDAKVLNGRFRYLTLGSGTFLFVWLTLVVLLFTTYPY